MRTVYCKNMAQWHWFFSGELLFLKRWREDEIVLCTILGVFLQQNTAMLE